MSRYPDDGLLQPPTLWDTVFVLGIVVGVAVGLAATAASVSWYLGRSIARAFR